MPGFHDYKPGDLILYGLPGSVGRWFRVNEVETKISKGELIVNMKLKPIRERDA